MHPERLQVPLHLSGGGAVAENPDLEGLRTEHRTGLSRGDAPPICTQYSWFVSAIGMERQPALGQEHKKCDMKTDSMSST